MLDLSGKRYGKLVVLKRKYIKVFPSGQRTSMWLCVCDCGKTKVVQYSSLTSKKTRGCSTCNYNPKNVVNPKFSPEDADLSAITWLGVNDYARRNHVRAHRVVLERKIGRPLVDGELTDHINRDKLDNRRENLRIADKSVNAVNTGIRADNSTGYNGVHLYWPKEYQKRGWAKRWVFHIHRKNQKTFYSKSYKTPEEAHEARLEKLKEYIY